MAEETPELKRDSTMAVTAKVFEQIGCYRFFFLRRLEVIWWLAFVLFIFPN